MKMSTMIGLAVAAGGLYLILRKPTASGTPTTATINLVSAPAIRAVSPSPFAPTVRSLPR